MRQSFTQFAPKINPDLVADALRSFGDDRDVITEVTFMATFDEGFDNQLNQSRGMSPAKRPNRSAARATNV